jgi:YD repeat-containing protein
LCAQRGTNIDAFTYDAAGSLLSSLEQMDGRRVDASHEVGPGNVLLRAGDTTYAYDERRRRVRKVRPAAKDEAAETTEYSWDARDLMRGAVLPDGTRLAFAYDAVAAQFRDAIGDPFEAAPVE